MKVTTQVKKQRSRRSRAQVGTAVEGRRGAVVVKWVRVVSVWADGLRGIETRRVWGVGLCE